MKKTNMLIILLFLCILLAPSYPTFAEASNYTYTYDFWDIEQSSPDAYNPIGEWLGKDLGIDNFKDPQGLFIRDNRLFICDSGNNRIVVIEYINEKHQFIKEITSTVINGEESNLSNPTDVFETEIGDLFICDTNNQRILHLDASGNFIKEITKPQDESIAIDADFLPLKLIVDKADRIYVQVKNVNKGLMEFDGNGDFTGYVGANKVQVNIKDYIWKMISTKAQRAQMQLFVPTEYNNLCLDEDGFIYATTSTFDADTITKANPIRRLNSIGTDILVRNGWVEPIGDLQWSDEGGINGSSRFVDVVAMKYDSYGCLDRVRGRIFMYDFQGNLLYAFGGNGNKLGSFLYPVAIDNMEDSLYVLDARTGGFTRFELSEYGRFISEGIAEYKKGNYELSSKRWEEVLRLNGNYDLAYIGIGRALLRQGEYKEAMEYFKVKRDTKNYSKAFQLYRKEWIEDNIIYLLIGIGAVIIIPKLISFGKKVKKEVFEE